MKMRGWVFVVTNPLAPELCRVSFSAKDPKWRAREMNKNAAGQPFIVEYAVVVDNPHWYKLIACRKLTADGKHELKDWFRCPPEDAAAAIREAVGDNRIFSELMRGVENVKRVEPGPENGAVPESLASKESGTPLEIKERGVPVQESGQVEQDSLELAAAIRKALEEAEKPSPVNKEIAHENGEEAVVKIEDVLDAVLPQDVGKQEVDRIIEEKRLREKREEVRQDVEEVRRRMEEIKRTEQEPPPQPKEHNFSVASISTEDEKRRSEIWEVVLISLTDLGCVYLVFVAKSVLILSVAIILSAIFTLLIWDMARTHLRGVGKKKSQKA